MHAAGNDYVYFEQNEVSDEELPELSKQICDRHKSVGADGIIALTKTQGGIIFKMFNADGSEGRICGNGIRCAAAFAARYMGMRSPIKFFTLAGERTVSVETIKGKTVATAEMGEPKEFISSEYFAEKLQEIGLYVNKRDVFAINVGNDHAVFFSGLPLSFAAKETEKTGLFPCGINVECAGIIGSGIKAEVFERGSGETLSCGSGAVAIVYAAVISKRATEGQYTDVCMPGGNLAVKISGGKAFLKGEVNEVFKGEYEI